MKYLFSSMMMFVLSIMILRADVVVEAEDAEFDGKVANNHSGYSGSGFVDVGNKSGSYIIFQFSIDRALPEAEVRLRWANGKDDSRDIEVQVNGEVAIAQYPMGTSGGFTTWLESTLTLPLRAGKNEILLTSLTSVGMPNIDKITIVGAEPGPEEFALNVSINGKGSVIKQPDQPFYVSGSQVQLTAVPDKSKGAVFTGWSGASNSKDSIITLTINKNTDISAHFKSSSYTSYYCAPKEKGGSDSNDGSKEAPFFNLSKAISLMEPGDTVFMRGGIYRYNATINLKNSGNAAEYYHIFNEPGETPELNFYDIIPDYSNTSQRGNGRGFKVTGDYYHMKGLTICQAPDNGIKVEGSHNIFELLVLHHNGDSGIQIGLSSNAADAADKVCNNLVKNCDSYRNYDWGTSYENADGFACKLSPGANNRFVGCRAWENSDDGWDFYMTHFPIYLDSCWTMGNGNEELIKNDPDWEWGRNNSIGSVNWQGDGNGFKLGGDGWAAKHQVNNCIAFDGYATGAGFSENNNADSIFLFNCLSFYNIKNYRLRKYPCDVRNCISFHQKPNGGGQSALYDIMEGSIELNNSWNSINGEAPMVPYKDANNKLFDQESIYEDFISLSKEDFLAPREADGSLPDNGFGRLKADSRFVDKGTNQVKGVSKETHEPFVIDFVAGVDYFGVAKDLGAYETDGEISSIPCSGSDIDFFKNYPNPVKTHTTFFVHSQETATATLDIVDLAGKVVFRQYLDLMKGENRQVLFQSDGLPSGIYQAVLKQAGKHQILKIVVEN